MRNFDTYERKTKRELVQGILVTLGLEEKIRGRESKRLSKLGRFKLETMAGVA